MAADEQGNLDVVSAGDPSNRESPSQLGPFVYSVCGCAGVAVRKLQMDGELLCGCQHPEAHSYGEAFTVDGSG
ncbi:MAG: hypothetical protein OEZ06_11450 [Myxococcales bacterium]|nr:hypothetical protein [Myxococcales bacterium]